MENGARRGVNVRHHGKLVFVPLDDEGSKRGLVKQVQERLFKETGIEVARQKLVARGGTKIGFDGNDDERLLRSLVTDCAGEKKAQLQMVGTSALTEQNIKESAAAAEKHAAVRVINDLGVDYDVVAEERRVASTAKEREYRRKDAMSTPYRFNEIKPLEQFKNHDKAREILEDLAHDPGFLAVLRKHRWTVGCLSELYPEGQVGIDPVCVLGLNVNKGQEIKLRLRTDDLKGWRKMSIVRKTLAHELSHNVWSDHDEKFYKLMRQIEREVEELDWRKSKGYRLGGEEATMTAALVARVPKQKGPTGGVYTLGSSNEPGSRNQVQTAAGEALSKEASNEKSCPCGAAHDQDASVKLEAGEDTVQVDEQGNSKKLPQDDNALDLAKERERIDSQGAVPGAVDEEDNEQQVPRPPLPPLADERVGEIKNAVAQIVERNDLSEAKASIEFLSKILCKILEYPQAAKFRRMKLTASSFQKHITNVLGARNILQTLGWELGGEDNDHLFLVDESDAALSTIDCGVAALADARELIAPLLQM